MAFKIDLTLFNNHLLYCNWVFYVISISSSFSNSYTSLVNVGHLRTSNISDFTTWPLSFGISLNRFFDPPLFYILHLYIICYTNNYSQQLFDYLSFWGACCKFVWDNNKHIGFNSRAEFWGILFWLSIILSQISIVLSWYPRSSTVPSVFLKKCALKIPGSNWALSKSSFMFFFEIWFFISAVGTWKTLALLLLLTALKNETVSDN